MYFSIVLYCRNSTELDNQIMKTVYSKEELIETLKKGETALVKGALASEIRKRYETKKKVRKGGMIGGAAIAVAGVLAAPFTGGTSLIGTAAGLGAMGLTIGVVSLTATELAIILGIIAGAGLAAYGIYKGAKVTFRPDGSVVIEPKQNHD